MTREGLNFQLAVADNGETAIDILNRVDGDPKETAPGLLLGLIIGGVCAELIRSLLFGVQPLDGIIFAAVGVVVLLCAAAACLYPAWRAAHLDPVTALKYE